MSEQKRGESPAFQHVDELPWTNGKATSLTGDPVDLGRGLTVEGQRQLFEQQNPVQAGHVDFGKEEDTDFAIPGLDPDAVAPDGVDAAADDSGCEGGACKI